MLSFPTTESFQLSAHVDLIILFELTSITENIVKKLFQYELRSFDEQIVVTLNYVLQNKIAQSGYKSWKIWQSNYHK